MGKLKFRVWVKISLLVW